jgi:prophage regulatory protein
MGLRERSKRREVRAMTEPDVILREPEERRLTGLCRTTRWKLEKAGDYPEAIQLTGRARGHLRSEVLAWLAKRRRGTVRRVA